MQTTRSNRVANLTLRLGLAGLGLLLSNANSAKAQECCPDQYTEAEVAKMQTSAKKPISLAGINSKQAQPVLVAKIEPSVALTKASRKEKPQGPANVAAIAQPVKNPEDKE